MMLQNSIIGARIREFRKARKWSREKLAEIIGVAPVTVARWETGDFAARNKYLEALAKAFKIPLGRLVNVDAGPCTLEHALLLIERVGARNKELEALIEAVGEDVVEKLAAASASKRAAILKILN